MIYGMDTLIEKSTGLPVIMVDDPSACAAHGAGKLLSKLDSMEEGMMNFLRKRQMRN